jgi:signal transduction histidine kinase
VSHEIRNPLSAIYLHVDLLEEELRQPSPESPTTMAEALIEIKTQLARLDDLLQD